ncbi:MAG: glycosyltransferase family 2 protein [Coriobacteriales bacterium]|nr:glycosyltransferase family 2 protein [Coriobacteriales bacterium]
MDISVVVPVYGCPEALPELYQRLTDTLSALVDSYEIILVDDRCPKNSWQGIRALAEKDSHVVGIHLARNTGQSRAITCGLDNARGNWAVVMDCDCQDPPEAIPDLYAKALSDHKDIVFARRVGRKDSRITLALSHAYYRLYSHLADAEVDPSIGNFSIASRRAYQAYLSMREQARDYSLFMSWLGFDQGAIDIEPEERFAGESSYTFGKKISLAIETITSHSKKPLTLAVKLGFAMAVVSFIMLVVLVIHHLLDTDVPVGWASMIASVFFVGGMTIAVVGMVGIYVGNTFIEARERPLYQIQDKINGE